MTNHIFHDSRVMVSYDEELTEQKKRPAILEKDLK